MAGLRAPAADIGLPRPPIRSSLALLGLFAFLLVAFALLERIGVESGFVPEAVIFAALGICAVAALFSPGSRPGDYYAAGRAIPAALGGLAGAASIAGLLVIGLAGRAFGTATEFLLSAFGLLVGLALAGLFAPALRRFGGYTAADFLAARFGGMRIRLAAALVAFTASFVLFAAQLKSGAALLTNLIGLEPEHGLYAATGLAAIALLPGGMRSLTWTQMVQYCVSALACLAPAAFLAAQAGSAPEPGAAVSSLQSLLPQFAPFSSFGDAARNAFPVFLLAAGVASLPQILTLAGSAASARDAGMSMIWAILLSVVLIAAGLVLGQSLGGLGAMEGVEGTGDLLGLALPILAALPSILAGLLMAGALAALFATGQAALFCAASALSHDVFDAVIDRNGAAGRRIVVARLIVVAVAVLAAASIARLQLDAEALLGWALALAAAGNFAPLLLGIWWPRASAAGALSGMLAGFGLAALAFLLESGLVPAWVAIAPAGIGPAGASAIGVSAACLVTIAVSLLGPEPKAEARALVAALHDPRGKPPMRERPA